LMRARATGARGELFKTHPLNDTPPPPLVALRPPPTYANPASQAVSARPVR
jgi:hypothetical protein